LLCGHFGSFGHRNTTGARIGQPRINFKAFEEFFDPFFGLKGEGTKKICGGCRQKDDKNMRRLRHPKEDEEEGIINAKKKIRFRHLEKHIARTPYNVTRKAEGGGGGTARRQGEGRRRKLYEKDGNNLFG